MTGRKPSHVRGETSSPGYRWGKRHWPHFSDEEKTRIIASYPKRELEARTKGIPILGSGRIFPVEESKIVCEYRDFPSHWPRIGGMDFGWDHPFAAVELVWESTLLGFIA